MQLLLFIIPGLLVAEPVINARSAVLIDNTTGAILFEKNSNLSIPPASMTKLMTLYIVYKYIEDGKLSKDELIHVGKNADFRSLPAHSSLMFLEKGQDVSLMDLMLGLAVPSGNDAAIAVAERVAGSVQSFVNIMNLEAEDLGLKSVHFEDASGLSKNNRVTAADFVRFCRIYIKTFPEALKELHSVASFTYPKEKNWKTNGSSVYGPITQNNRNNLLSVYAPVDGLKTGYIDESGFNISLTAKQDGRRLIVVLLGGPGNNSSEGSLYRAVDGISLLSYGFYHFTNVKSEVPHFTAPKIWKGSEKSIELNIPEIPVITLTVEQAGLFRVKVDISKNIIAPIKKGDILGKVIQYSGEKILNQYNITAAEDVPVSGFFMRMTDSIKIFFLKLAGDY